MEGNAQLAQAALAGSPVLITSDFTPLGMRYCCSDFNQFMWNRANDAFPIARQARIGSQRSPSLVASLLLRSRRIGNFATAFSNLPYIRR